MNEPSNHLIDQVADFLMDQCHELGIFETQTDVSHKKDDLIDNGLIDSMGMMYMQAMIHETFGMELTPELFITELRNIQSIALYMTEQLPAEELEKSMSASLAAGLKS